jgi:hypothetical protein
MVKLSESPSCYSKPALTMHDVLMSKQLRWAECVARSARQTSHSSSTDGCPWTQYMLVLHSLSSWSRSDQFDVDINSTAAPHAVLNLTSSAPGSRAPAYGSDGAQMADCAQLSQCQLNVVRLALAHKQQAASMCNVSSLSH